MRQNLADLGFRQSEFEARIVPNDEPKLSGTESLELLFSPNPGEPLKPLRLIASRNAGNGTVKLYQDASVYAAKLSGGQSVQHELAPERHAWVQVARGSVELNGQSLRQGDGAAVSAERSLEFKATAPAELLLFDLA